MGTNTLLGFAAAIVFLLLWSSYSKQRGFVAGFFGALVTVGILVGIVLVIVRLAAR